MISKTNKYMLQAILLLFLFGSLVFYYYPLNVVKKAHSYKSFYDTNLIVFSHFHRSEVYNENCFDGKLINSIEGLSQNLEVWLKAYERHCQVLWKKFQLIYRVEVRQGKVSLPVPFTYKVQKWLNNDSKLMLAIKAQKVYHIYNYYTHEYTVYNVIRSKRPMQMSGNDPKKYVMELSIKTKQDCDFCHYCTMTAQDVFGRIESEHSSSAANLFKLDKWHGLFLTKKHNLLELIEEEFIDWFNTSLSWFKKVNSIDEESRFPMLFWDNLPHAGASQFHPHIHGILGSQHYHGDLSNQLLAATSYHKDTGFEYWSDFVEIHIALGLAIRFGKAVVIAPLSSKKDHELLLLSSMPCMDLYRLLFYVIQMYHSELNQFCYSSGMALPVMKLKQPKDALKTLPAFIRIGTRGNCESLTSDESSLELYTMYNLNVDSYTTISKLQKTIDKLYDPSKLSDHSAKFLQNMYDEFSSEQ